MSTSVLDVSDETGAVRTLPVGGILSDGGRLNEDLVIVNGWNWHILNSDCLIGLCDDGLHGLRDRGHVGLR